MKVSKCLMLICNKIVKKGPLNEELIDKLQTSS